jgi:hypothetical protein
MAEVDRSAWDGNRALREATTAAEYDRICALDRGASITALRDRFGLPHHYLAKAPVPNVGGVRAARNALAGGRTGKPMTGAGIAEARAHLERHWDVIQAQSGARDLPDPPKEIIRSIGELELQEPPGDGTLGTLVGRMAVFGEWAEIDSMHEGHFVERVAPGSFLRSIDRDRDRYRALYDHGMDPSIGRKVLGPVKGLGEDIRGAFYAVGLLDTTFNRDLLPGLKAGLYGSSFRGQIAREQFDHYARASEHNPEGLAERTVQEVALRDFGPTPFPAYVGATAGARSLGPDVWTPARRRERLIEVL